MTDFGINRFLTDRQHYLLLFLLFHLLAIHQFLALLLTLVPIVLLYTRRYIRPAGKEAHELRSQAPAQSQRTFRNYYWMRRAPSFSYFVCLQMKLVHF